jgi:hypothetical protein
MIVSGWSSFWRPLFSIRNGFCAPVISIPGSSHLIASFKIKDSFDFDGNTDDLLLISIIRWDKLARFRKGSQYFFARGIKSALHSGSLVICEWLYRTDLCLLNKPRYAMSHILIRSVCVPNFAEIPKLLLLIGFLFYQLRYFVSASSGNREEFVKRLSWTSLRQETARPVSRGQEGDRSWSQKHFQSGTCITRNFVAKLKKQSHDCWAVTAANFGMGGPIGGNGQTGHIG